jgi:hypothetical protein
MQNRESAVRSRHKKKETSKIIETENEHLRMENYRLYHENKNLKTEKNFLVDQIKFMQNLIKSNNLNLVVKSTPINDGDSDIEKNIPNKSENSSTPASTVQLNGARQRPFGKYFSVFLVCILSITYVSFDDASEFGSGEKIVISSGSTITLNDSSQRHVELRNSTSLFSYIATGLFVFICGFITWNICELYSLINYFVIHKILKREKLN